MKLTLKEIQAHLARKLRRPVSTEEAIRYLDGVGLLEVAKEIKGAA